MPECVGDNRACRISTQSYSPNMAFSTLYRNENPICECGNGAACSNVWDSSSNTTVTFFLATRGIIKPDQIKLVYVNSYSQILMLEKWSSNMHIYNGTFKMHLHH